MNAAVFELPIRVSEIHIDELGHVNNVVYLQWVQDAAAAHWSTNAPSELRHQFNWVVLRHEIDYKSPAFVNDELMARTWVDHYDGVRSTRIVQIFRSKEMKKLAEARTQWCLLNAATGRPTRVVDEIKNVFVPTMLGS